MTWLKQLFLRRQLYTDLSEEIGQHLEQKAAELISSGMSREDAERQARREFGNVGLIEQRSREAWQWPTFESLWADVRDAARQLRKRPLMALIVVLTFGLGIGASTATFSVANAFLFSPLGLPHPDNLIVLQEQRSGYDYPSSYADFASWQQASKSFSEMAAHTGAHLDLTGSGEPQRLNAELVSPNFFHLLGINPKMGRDFVAAEPTAGRDLEVMLSYALWQHRFGGDTKIVGQRIVLNKQSYSVVGIMPKGFHYPQSVDVWVPLALTDAERNDRKLHNLVVVGRLKDGVSIPQAQSEMRTIAARLAQQYPSTNTNTGTRVVPLAVAINSEMTQAYTRMMLGSTFFVMLVVCANVANLSLARVLARRHELAVRVTLGALRWRIVRQLLTESALLGMLGGAAGIGIAALDLHFILISMPPEVARYVYNWDKIGLNLTVLAGATVVALLSGLVAGLIPALLVTGNSSAGMATLSAARTTTDSRQTHRIRNIFAVIQIALALVLVSGAGLFVQGMRHMLSMEEDYQPKTLLTFSVNLPDSRYTNDQQRGAFYQGALERLQQVPGVTEATIAGTFPYGNGDAEWKDFIVEGRPQVPGTLQSSQAIAISPEYLQMLHIPVVYGHGITASDGPESPRVLLINEKLAAEVWPNQDPLGRRLRLDAWGDDAAWATVTGVVKDVVYTWADRAAEPTIYIPAAQHPPTATFFAVRTSGNALALAPAVRSAIYKIDADLPIEQTRTYERVLHDSLIGLWYVVVMMGAMGGITLLLGALGIYGVLSSGVQERTREIGVRMALGASRADIRRRTLLEGARLFAFGAVIGLPCALLLARLLAGLIFGVSATDLGTLMFTILLAGAAAVLASWLPALRASSVDPVRALRGE
jgi:putative ABC transport system permease protein